ncbi:LysR family transcriptional regulator [Jannaschia sp. LMIT008]|uniref:LysR family transcriptional regulator n=1 Tax=Jannaschia maritima TaxID=3032585 RepID=UPI00281171AE|nr:LysR family transcriptional regulator [Jannaschia sp. LMIT008]
MTTLPHLNHLRSFEVSARTLSFTRAAAELNYTQSAVSGHVRALEDFIGRPLFVRHPRSLSLTSLGEAYLPTVQHMLTQIDAATEAIMAPRHGRRVVVSAPVSLATNWLPSRLAAFRATEPGIDVTVHARIWTDEDPEVADIRVSAARRAEVPATARVLWADRLVVLAPPDAAPRTPPAMMEAALIHNLGRPDYWFAVGERFGLPGLHALGGLRTSSLNTAMELAVAGAGLAVVPLAVAALHLERGLLVAPFEPVDSDWVNVLSDESLLKSREARLLHAFLAQGGEGAPHA